MKIEDCEVVYFCSFFVLFCLVGGEVLGIKLRTSGLLDKHCTAELYPQIHMKLFTLNREIIQGWTGGPNLITGALRTLVVCPCDLAGK